LGGRGVLGDLKVLNDISDFQQNLLNSMTIDGTVIPFSGVNTLVTTAAADRWFRSRNVPLSPHDNNDGVREKLRIIASAINATAGLPYRAEVWGYHLAIIARSGPFSQLPTISLTPTNATTDLLTDPLTDARNGRQFTLGTSGGGPFSVAGAGGSDGGAPAVGDYVGDPVTQKGFHALDPVDLFNLMAIPADQGVSEADYLNIIGPASNYCAGRRAFLLVDAPPSWTAAPSTTNPVTRPAIVQNTSRIDSEVRSKVVKINSAVFYPRLIFNDLGLNKPIGLPERLRV
jgi:hypothetical protein